MIVPGIPSVIHPGFPSRNSSRNSFWGFLQKFILVFFSWNPLYTACSLLQSFWRLLQKIPVGNPPVILAGNSTRNSFSSSIWGYPKKFFGGFQEFISGFLEEFRQGIPLNFPLKILSDDSITNSFWEIIHSFLQDFFRQSSWNSFEEILQGLLLGFVQGFSCVDLFFFSVIPSGYISRNFF